MKRKPAVSGRFYESSSSGLSRQVGGYVEAGAVKTSAAGIIVPHAGLMYSGMVAGAVYSRIEIPHTFVMLGPNHTGMGSPVSIMSSGTWEVPTGSIMIDERFAGRLKGHSRAIAGIIDENSLAHQQEHSLEVQLPFILYFSSSVKIVPVAMMPVPLETCRLLGEALADEIRTAGYGVSIIASSDMSHYETDAAAREKDGMALDRVLAMDPEGLYRTVSDEGISMCGVIPAVTMLFAALKLGAAESVLVKYMTSGEVSGDFDHVVGYAGVIVT